MLLHILYYNVGIEQRTKMTAAQVNEIPNVFQGNIFLKFKRKLFPTLLSADSLCEVDDK